MKLTKGIVQAEDPSTGSLHSGSSWNLKSQSQKFQVTKRMVFEAGGFLLAMIFDDIGFLAWLLGSACVDYSEDKNKDQKSMTNSNEFYRFRSEIHAKSVWEKQGASKFLLSISH